MSGVGHLCFALSQQGSSVTFEREARCWRYPMKLCIDGTPIHIGCLACITLGSLPAREFGDKRS